MHLCFLLHTTNAHDLTQISAHDHFLLQMHMSGGAWVGDY